MGLFARLAALIRGSFRKTVNELEVKNPDALLEDLRERIEKTASFMGIYCIISYINAFV